MDRSLKTRYPKLFKELDNKKNHLNINKISYGSNQQVYWICSKKHSWLAKPKERTRNKNPKRCTVCRSLDFNYPELIKEWDFKKNKLDPKTTNYGSKNKVWWNCKKCKYNFKASINNRASQGTGCPACSGTVITDSNRLSKLFPNLVEEWHSKKNGNKKPEDFSYGSDEKVWWLCKKCLFTYKSAISKRAYKKDPRGCPACSGTIVSDLNRISVKFPELNKEWHPTKNGKKTTADYSFGSKKKVWWICKKEHVWEAVIGNRTRGAGCPKCNPHSSRLEIRLYSEIKALIPKTNWREKIRGKEVDIFLKEQMIAIELDGSYWHKNKILKDLNKNRELIKSKVKIIRLREKPLKLISKNDLSFSSTDAHIDIIHDLLNKIIKLIKNKKLIRKIKNYINKEKFINEKEYLRVSSYLPGPTPENSLLAKSPEIAKQWHYKLNYPLKPEMFFQRSDVSVFWVCNKFKEHVWKARIAAMTGNNCIYCAGKKVSRQNSFAINYPELLEEFDYKKNKGINPNDFVFGSQKKVWWNCNVCNHKWKTAFGVRSRGHGCYWCGKKNRKKTINDSNKLSILYPELCEEWDYKKNKTTPNEHSYGSSKPKVWWKCKKGHSWQTAIHSRTKSESGCPKCSTTINQYS